ncbi:MAG: magnesium transporter, partial [Erysipelotrichaceae bacterium]|nr:magnesium transporter [Erysipelotrichaceae bacterium]
SSFVGTTVPIIFDKLHIDPAVASGPFITTINDLIAVISYYGLAWILLLNVLHM